MEQKRTSQRLPVNGTRNRLSVKNKDPNFVYRVVNDIEDRIEYFHELGYEVVMKDIKTRDKTAVDGTKLGTPMSVSVGGGVKGIVMRCPKEIFDERQAAKAADVQSLEDSLKDPKSNNADYGKVSIKRS